MAQEREKEPIKVDPVKKVRRITVEEILNFFYNKHLREIVTCWVDIELFKTKDPNDHAYDKVKPPPGPNQMPIAIPVKIKEAIEEQKKTLKFNADIIDAIDKRMAELKKFKNDTEIWRKK